MMVKIDVSSEAAKKFQIAAEALNISIQEYLDQLATVICPISTAQFAADMEVLSEGTDHLSPSANTYTRKDIYFDHD